MEDIRRQLGRAADGSTAARLRREHGSEMPCYGIPPQRVASIALDFVRRMRSGGLALALETTGPLWRSGNLEEGMVAAQVAGAMKRHIGGGEFERFHEWAGALTNAPNADGLGTHLVCHALAAKPSLALRLQEWARSPSRWRRRAAVMSFVPLVREGRFLTDALEVVALLMDDEDEQVQEAVGTLLMEASRLQAPRVVEFLQPWKEKGSPALLRRAASKLSAEDRSAVLSP